ncbi:MAG: hypothetical protein M3336_15235 [Chloroflexota bacterium]|nr:hypothetical protein [Chloroflexota bacterium]
MPLLLPVSGGAQETGWTFELYGGSAYSVPAPLTIRQTGEPDITITARYATKPWEGSPYYAYRFGRWSRGKGWELELIHHKLYLENPPPEVQHFELSHGYNMVSVNRAVQRRGVILRLGAGVVIAYPHGTTVRQRLLPNSGGLFGRGYHLSGPMAQLAVGKRFVVWKGLFLALEGKLTGAYARIPLQSGSATAPNAAVHGLLGVGYTIH